MDEIKLAKILKTSQVFSNLSFSPRIETLQSPVCFNSFRHEVLHWIDWQAPHFQVKQCSRCSYCCCVFSARLQGFPGRSRLQRHQHPLPVQQYWIHTATRLGGHRSNHQLHQHQQPVCHVGSRLVFSKHLDEGWRNLRTWTCTFFLQDCWPRRR